MYKTRLTSQGTITLPSALRRKYNLRAGDILTIGDNQTITISRPLDFRDVRERNKSRVGTRGTYRAGDGFTAHVTEKYGKK